ncbi:MAG: nucleotide exchange factor GrpE [Prevotella sp.]|nr:nucleotide exchange factor GrpE [Prevotella sp.]
MEEKTNINEENILDKEEMTEETVNDNSADGQQQEEEAGTEEKAEEKDPLTLANEKIAELEDKYLRTVAEFDNYRKRVLKEKTELILNGGARVAEAVLPVLDDMERAIANGEKTDDLQVLREGMELIHAKFVKTLESQGVKKIETENADFDTDVHEAVAMVPGMGDDKKGKVIDCIQAGYKINDKVIRHAKVAVGQ